MPPAPPQLPHPDHLLEVSDDDVAALLPLAGRVLTPPRVSRNGPRDLSPAAAAASLLTVTPAAPGYPTLTVVGSKGKGTATLAASAALNAAGLRVGTVTSPSFVTMTERIRVDGTAIAPAAYVRAAARVEHAVAAALSDHPDWVTPHLGGMHFLAALDHFRGTGLDVAVFEASMGGRQDEVALLHSSVVVVTELFEEHVGTLGANVYEIALEKLGAVSATAQVIVTVEQSDPVRRAFTDSGVACRTRIVTVPHGTYGHHRNPLIDRNIELGRVAAAEHLALTGTGTAAVNVPSQLRLPGRCSPVGAAGMADCAVTATGVQAALTEYEAEHGQLPPVAMTCFPTSKDDAGAIAALVTAGVDVVGVSLPWLRAHLQPDPAVYAPHPILGLGDVTWPAGSWIALGTVSFIAEVLTQDGQDLSRLW